MDCPKHPIRKRPKTCETCAAPYVDPTKATTGQHAYPHVTEDGMTWLDPDGNPPVADYGGRLKEPFVLDLKYGARERWGVGLVLPQTPEAYRRAVTELEAQRKKAGG